MKSNILLFIFSVFLFSCKHPQTVVPNISTIVICDSNNVSYSKDIIGILKTHCYDCHSGLVPTAGLHLEYYNVDSSLAINDHYLENIVNGNPNYIYMPPAPYQKLTVCEISKIRIWTKAGCPKN